MGPAVPVLVQGDRNPPGDSSTAGVLRAVTGGSEGHPLPGTSVAARAAALVAREPTVVFK